MFVLRSPLRGLKEIPELSRKTTGKIWSYFPKLNPVLVCGAVLLVQFLFFFSFLKLRLSRTFFFLLFLFPRSWQEMSRLVVFLSEARPDNQGGSLQSNTRTKKPWAAIPRGALQSLKRHLPTRMISTLWTDKTFILPHFDCYNNHVNVHLLYPTAILHGILHANQRYMHRLQKWKTDGK